MAKSQKKKKQSYSQRILLTARDLALNVDADRILVVAGTGLGKALIQALNEVRPTLIVTRSRNVLRGIEELGVQRLNFDFNVDDLAYFERVRQGIILGMEGGYIQRGDRLVCLTCVFDHRGADTVIVVDTSKGFEGHDPENIGALAGDLPLEVVRAVLDLSQEIGREGREGDPVGTLFVLGDSERVMANSRTMTFDPFLGYPEREKNICTPANWEGIKEVALMDGAFIVQDDGVILSGGRYITADVRGMKLPKGLGARHVAAASITNHTKAIAVAISESTGTVRAFKGGDIVMSIYPSRRHVRQERRR